MSNTKTICQKYEERIKYLKEIRHLNEKEFLTLNFSISYKTLRSKKGFKESILIFKTINLKYSIIHVHENIKKFIQSGVCNYIFFNDLKIYQQNINQALHYLPFSSISGDNK